MRTTRFVFGAIFALVLCSAVASASPVTLSVLDHPFNVDGGGSFTGKVNDGAAFQVYCIDFENTVGVPSQFAVNVSTLGELVKTRYGTTMAADFSFGGLTPECLR